MLDSVKEEETFLLLQKVHFPHHSAKGLKTSMQTGATGDFRAGDILLFRQGRKDDEVPPRNLPC